LNIKLKDKKEVAMNGVLAQTNGGAGKKFNNKSRREKKNKFDSIIYHCFICNFVEHKIYNYPHKDIAQAMFKEKGNNNCIQKGKCYCEHGFGNYNPHSNTQKCGIQGESASQEQEISCLARRGKASTFI
jgi:hypothetical protein